MTIKLLEDRVIAQNAAGEVVERPASVVKELVENALDADARTIQITFDGGGQRLIRVSDDGHGIAADEVELAFSRHATSKLETTSDLDHIRTLGFRGEALASIAAISHVAITSRHIEQSTGVQLRLEAGEIVQRRTIGAPAGTIITIENLFFNTPARLKFLKSENTEKRHIVNVVTHYAMAYPHIRFVLEQDNREVFRSNGSGQLSDVLVAALGLDMFREMVEVQYDERALSKHGQIHVMGYTSAPSLHRADRSRIALFVNGRWIQDASLAYGVTQAYHTFLEKGRYPIATLMIELPTDLVDVNVHPTKAEVRFQDPNSVFAAVQRAVRRALVDTVQVSVERSDNYRAGNNKWESTYSPAQQALQLDLTGADNNTPVDLNELTYGNIPDSTPYDPEESAARPRTLPVLRVVGQIGANYIVAEGPASLYLIDQHAAHFRILYEDLNAQRMTEMPVETIEYNPQSIELTASDVRLLESNSMILNDFGLAVEPFGTNAITFRTVPRLLENTEPSLIARALIQALIGKSSDMESVVMMQIARLAAVKAGTLLSMNEMQALIRKLERCPNPQTTPEGQPTLLHMTSDHLARQFERR